MHGSRCPSPEAAAVRKYNLSMDIAGPFRVGWDFGYGQEARYGLLATVPVPLGTEVDEELPKKEEGVSEEPGEAEVQHSEDPEPLNRCR